MYPEEQQELGAATDATPSPIVGMIETNSKVLHELNALMKDLAVKLSPILEQINKKTEDEKISEPSGSAVLQMLTDQNTFIGNISKDLKEIITRIQV